MSTIKRKHSTIKANEMRGNRIETIIQAMIFESVRPFAGQGPYDLETKTEIIEVKSCRATTKNHVTKKGRKYIRAGRFIIDLHSHKKLLEAADERNKTCYYIFVIYEYDKRKLKIVETINVSWKQVDWIIQGSNTYKRKDGARFAQINSMRILWEKHHD